VRYCYEQLEIQTEPHEDWKKKRDLGFNKKGFKSLIFNNYSKDSRISLPTRSVYHQNFPSQSGNKPFGATPGKTDNPNKEPLKCCSCGEEHLLRDCPHRKHKSRRVYNIQEAITINDVARSMPQIYAVVDNKQADHQDSVVEMEGMIANHLVSILIDLGCNLSYVAPQTVDQCKLHHLYMLSHG
jgi:hypothetical protein